MEGAITMVAICSCVAICLSGWPKLITINKHYHNHKTKEKDDKTTKDN